MARNPEASTSAMASVDADTTADDSDVEDPEDVVQLSSEGEGST